MEFSANQLYKSSDSNLSFKQWLKVNQESGNLQNHEQMFNADGENNSEKKEQKNPKSIFKMNKNNLIGLIGVGLLVYGFSIVNKVSSEQ